MARAKKELKDNSAAVSTPSSSNRNFSSHRQQVPPSRNAGVRHVSGAHKHSISSSTALLSHSSATLPERDASEVSCCNSLSGASRSSLLSDCSSQSQKAEWQSLLKPTSPHYLSVKSPSSSQSSSLLNPAQDWPTDSDAGGSTPTSNFSCLQFDPFPLDMRSSVETNSDAGDLTELGLHDAMRGLRVGQSYSKEATDQQLSFFSDSGMRESSLETRSRLEEEEAELEDSIMEIIHSGQWDLLRPNTGQSVSLGDHHICVGYQEDPSSPGYRAWEWHGHIMVYEEGEGYTPEYVYGNYFEPMEDEEESLGMALGLGRGLGGIITGVERRGTCMAGLVGLSGR
eukprot:TRINITY_DN21534_c0_g1_i1.p1 TRINITY_DN21534_c0_g1~~TRINITY_DN21534_c0_g1_i1.p1  ORF type:complete len:353 (-),score=46.85 TRINITY_DN21534_c0_g1_i1:362-1384(-)